MIKQASEKWAEGASPQIAGLIGWCVVFSIHKELARLTIKPNQTKPNPLNFKWKQTFKIPPANNHLLLITNSSGKFHLFNYQLHLGDQHLSLPYFPLAGSVTKLTNLPHLNPARPASSRRNHHLALSHLLLPLFSFLFPPLPPNIIIANSSST